MKVLDARLRAGFTGHFGDEPDLVIRAPGRVNLIGEHTDYNDGFALPVAIGVETRLALRARGDGTVRVAALDFGEIDEFRIEGSIAKAAGGGWANYLRGVYAVMAQAGRLVTGADIAVAGSIPKGTGLSSSASLEVGLVKGLLALSSEECDTRTVALLAQRAECDFVGLRCGNLDQLASAGGKQGCAILIDCRQLTTTPVSVPESMAIMIVQSGVARGLVDGHYNLRRQQCELAAVELGVAALRDADMPLLASRQARMDPEVVRRARHVIGENARTLEAAQALRAGDLAAMGRLMQASHVSQRDDFEITVPETDRLVEIMTQAIGSAGGARQTGGGFGGAVVGVMPAAIADRVGAAVRSGYRTPNGAEPSVQIETACDGAGPA